MQSVKREIQQLLARVNQLSVAPKPRKRRKRRGNQGPANLLAASAAVTNNGGRSGRRRRKRGVGSQIAQSGDVTLERCEMLTALKLGSGKSTLVGSEPLALAKFGFLASMGKAFERVRWMQCHIWYKPAVGTNFGGLVTLGVDWNLGKGPTDRKGIVALTPNHTLACYADSEKSPMVLPSDRLMSRQWYDTSKDDADGAPGTLCWAVDSTAPSAETTVGEVWVRYRVVLSGTQ